MTLHLQRDRDHRRLPWRNGRGVTSEVACAPSGADAGSDFDWRVSFADVGESCDFSVFPDVDRVITLVDGPPMTLRLPDTTRVLRRHEPFAFDGEVPVRCEVLSPTRDLNVMTRRGRATATVDVLQVAPYCEPLALAPARPLLVAALGGAVRVVGDGVAALLRSGDMVTSDSHLLVDGEGHVAVVRIGVPSRPTTPPA